MGPRPFYGAEMTLWGFIGALYGLEGLLYGSIMAPYEYRVTLQVWEAPYRSTGALDGSGGSLYKSKVALYASEGLYTVL